METPNYDAFLEVSRERAEELAEKAAAREEASHIRRERIEELERIESELIFHPDSRNSHEIDKQLGIIGEELADLYEQGNPVYDEVVEDELGDLDDHPF